MTTSIDSLHALGQSLWYDNIERRLLENGELGAMITKGEIRGLTSNPAIFRDAIAKSGDYDSTLIPLAQAGFTADQIYEQLAIADIKRVADLLRPLYEQTQRGDGYVSLEVDPRLAYHHERTLAEAKRLWELVDRPNLMVKVPATEVGLVAVRQSIAAGINVNVTLIFSRSRYQDVMEAYLSGLEDRLTAGQTLDQIASVASFFVSRIDTKVDRLLGAIIQAGKSDSSRARALLGKLAVANARLAYQDFRKVFDSKRFSVLQASGARLQRPLWASTSTKNPAYEDTLYLDSLIGSHTVNTVPPQTLDAFRDHGKAGLTIERDLDAARGAFVEAAALGVDMEQVTQELEDEGVQAFADAFSSLLGTIEKRRQAVLLEGK